MKKIVTVFLALCLSLIVIVPLAGAEDVSVASSVEVSPIINERITNFLDENNIEYQLVDGNITLSETSPDSINEINQLLISDFNAKSDVARSTTYPTPYTHMKNYDVYTSKKFQAATKVALGAAVVEWAKNKFIPDPYKISMAAIGGFAVYYFVNTDTENLYFYISYHYRELGAGFFDGNGNFIGDYEILKEIICTKNSNYTGGYLETDARNSSIVEPWF